MDVVSRRRADARTIALSSQRVRGRDWVSRSPRGSRFEQSMVLGSMGERSPCGRVDRAGQPFEPRLARPVRGSPHDSGAERANPLISLREALGVSEGRRDLAESAARPPRRVSSSRSWSTRSTGRRELVIKPLSPLFAGHPLIRAAVCPVNVKWCSHSTRRSGHAPRKGGADGVSFDLAESGRRPVLVVDDSISVGKSSSESSGPKATWSTRRQTGSEALGKVRNNLYGLIVSDSKCPEWTVRALAELSRPEHRVSVPVIIASSNQTRDATEGHRLGAREIPAEADRPGSPCRARPRSCASQFGSSRARLHPGLHSDVGPTRPPSRSVMKARPAPCHRILLAGRPRSPRA